MLHLDCFASAQHAHEHRRSQPPQVCFPERRFDPWACSGALQGPSCTKRHDPHTSSQVAAARCSTLSPARPSSALARKQLLVAIHSLEQQQQRQQP